MSGDRLGELCLVEPTWAREGEDPSLTELVKLGMCPDWSCCLDVLLIERSNDQVQWVTKQTAVYSNIVKRPRYEINVVQFCLPVLLLCNQKVKMGQGRDDNESMEDQHFVYAPLFCWGPLLLQNYKCL